MNKLHITLTEDGSQYVAIYNGIYALGKTRVRALMNLLDRLVYPHFYA